MRNLHVAGGESQQFSPTAGWENGLLLPPGWQNSVSKENNDGYLVLCKGLKGDGTGRTKVYTFDFFIFRERWPDGKCPVRKGFDPALGQRGIRRVEIPGRRTSFSRGPPRGECSLPGKC